MFFYDEAFKAHAMIGKAFMSGELLGRMADGGPSLPWLANMAISGGSGDHLEIGTLFGASAMVVAAAKSMAGLSGTVYCIDPWGDRNKDHVGVLGKQAEEELSATKADVEENVKRINEKLVSMNLKPMKIELIKAKSQPWPKQLNDNKFVTSFIDGLHYNEMPKRDFEECAKRTIHYIGLDNYEESYPEVRDAVTDAISRKNGVEPDWAIYFKNSLFIALRRWQPPRGIRMASDIAHL